MPWLIYLRDKDISHLQLLRFFNLQVVDSFTAGTPSSEIFLDVVRKALEHKKRALSPLGKVPSRGLTFVNGKIRVTADGKAFDKTEYLLGTFEGLKENPDSESVGWTECGVYEARYHNPALKMLDWEVTRDDWDEGSY